MLIGQLLRECSFYGVEALEDFTPWETLHWEWVRVIRYRQRKPDGAGVEAYWLTNFPCSRVRPQSLYRLAQSRWEIENQGFKDAKNRFGLEHLCHHETNGRAWLLVSTE